VFHEQAEEEKKKKKKKRGSKVRPSKHNCYCAFRPGILAPEPSCTLFDRELLFWLNTGAQYYFGWVQPANQRVGLVAASNQALPLHTCGEWPCTSATAAISVVSQIHARECGARD
jgi:hypothetical protein